MWTWIGLGDIQYCRMHNDILGVDLFSAEASTCFRLLIDVF